MIYDQKFFLKKFKKGVDKPAERWYNKAIKERRKTPKNQKGKTMKKLYEVKVMRCDANDGKYTYYDTELVMEDDIEAYVEAKRKEIENRPCWWMDHVKEYEGQNEGRPRIRWEEKKVKGL